MAKALTPTAVERAKARDTRQEIPDGTVAGLFLIVQATTGSKSFALRFTRPDGKKGKLVLGPWNDSGVEGEETPSIGMPLTLHAARALAAAIHRDRQRGIDVIASRQKERVQKRAGVGATFEAAAVEFISEYRADRRGWREVAKCLGLDYPADGGEPKIGGLAERWRGRAVGSITGDEIYTAISEGRRRGIPGMGTANKGTSENRGRHLFGALSALFKWLLRHRRIDADPTFGIHRPKPPAKRQRILNCKVGVRDADELRTLWDATGQMGKPFGSLIRVLLLTGQRLNEIAAMEWRELDDGITTLTLPPSRTKNKKGHLVPISTQARDIISGFTRSGRYVFSTTSGKAPVSGFSKYKKRLDELMPGVEPWRVHDLRRTAASGMASIKVPPHVIEMAINHQSGFKGGVAGVYVVEQFEEEKRVALQAWADHVFGIVGC